MWLQLPVVYTSGFPSGAQGKESACQIQETQEIQVLSLDSLEKEKVTHSSILAWRIPWMEEPGRLQSMGSQRVGYD